MKVAVIGSRNLTVNNLERYLPHDTEEIVSGGARGIDTCAKNYALRHNLRLTEFLPDYQAFGRAAPIRRNRLIVDFADTVIAFWDGTSRGTKYVMDYCEKSGKTVKVFYPPF